MQALKQAVQLYQENQTVWQQLVQQAMAKDFSWDQSSDAYIDVYNQIRA